MSIIKFEIVDNKIIFRKGRAWVSTPIEEYKVKSVKIEELKDLQPYDFVEEWMKEGKIKINTGNISKDEALKYAEKIKQEMEKK